MKPCTLTPTEAAKLGLTPAEMDRINEIATVQALRYEVFQELPAEFLAIVPQLQGIRPLLMLQQPLPGTIAPGGGDGGG